MASAPTLSDAKWRKIESNLPTTRRDRLMISAILYRATSGQSVRETAAVFGVAKTKLHEWGNAVEYVLPQLMQKLGLEPAGSLAWRGGGQAWQTRHNCAAGVTALRLENFGRALRRT